MTDTRMILDRMERHHFAWLSIAMAVATIALKTAAWWVTGSVGLLSDAAESLVNLAGASFALWMILITRQPADKQHPFGHSKAEYFSSGFEGVLIFIAALAIIGTALQRLWNPQALDAVGWGLALSAISAVVNFVVAQTLQRAARRFDSIALEADAKHLMTDVWTSVGVIGGVVIVAATGWLWLDALVAILVGLHIVVEGYRLIRASANGMMDAALSDAEIVRIQAALQTFAARDIRYKNLKTRRAGAESFIHVDILAPRHWTIGQGHDMLDEIELRLAETIRGAVVVTHLEPWD